MGEERKSKCSIESDRGKRRYREGGMRRGGRVADRSVEDRKTGYLNLQELAIARRVKIHCSEALVGERKQKLRPHDVAADRGDVKSRQGLKGEGKGGGQ